MHFFVICFVVVVVVVVVVSLSLSLSLSKLSNVSDYKCVSDYRSRGREFDPAPDPILSQRLIIK